MSAAFVLSTEETQKAVVDFKKIAARVGADGYKSTVAPVKAGT
jgi:hypothetical protein